MGVNVNWPNPSTELDTAYPYDNSDSRKKISRCDILKANDTCAGTGTFILNSGAIIAMPNSQSKTTVSLTDYRALAEFRYQLMRYLALSDDAARSAGLHPGQYRLLLMVKGLPDGVEPTIGNLAERLGLRGLVDKRAFDRLCSNLHPFSGKQLTARMRADRTPGYDICFNACK